MKFLLVPPDTRPPTLTFPQRLIKATSHEVQVPPLNALNQLNQPGDYEALKRWLQTEVRGSDLLILSLEQLCLGGMIPARRVNDTFEQVKARLELLKTLKQAHANLRILAFGVIVRVAHGNDPLEEKAYFGEYGNALRAYSEAFDRFEREPSLEHESKLQLCFKALPTHILNDWLRTRKRNHLLHLEALELVKAGIIEHLCLTLDDTSTYGLAAADRRALEAKTDALNLWSQVDIYPGADEVPSTLIARALSPRPSKVYLHYSGVLGPQAELLFEDRPAEELIKTQLRAACCTVVSQAEKADFILAINTPATKQVHQQPDFATVDTAARYLPSFIDFIAQGLADKKPISLVDIAYPNGAEQRLMTLLDSLNLSDLAGFSGWNTAGNSLGTAIALGVLKPQFKDQKCFYHMLFDRLVDDYLYQSIVRSMVDKQLGGVNPFDLGSQKTRAERLINEKLEPLAQDLWQNHFSQLPYKLIWQAAKLSWPRLFTLELNFYLEDKHV